MARVIYTARAERDLDEIWKYIAGDNHPAAGRMLRRIDARAKAHADQPLMGSPSDDLPGELRYFVVGNYVAFYEPLKNGIRVMRVLHSARDIPAEFDSGGTESE